jgi:hypothetical protein
MSSDETVIYEFVTDLLSTGQVSNAPYSAVMDRFEERGARQHHQSENPPLL